MRALARRGVGRRLAGVTLLLGGLTGAFSSLSLAAAGRTTAPLVAAVVGVAVAVAGVLVLARLGRGSGSR